MNEIKYLTFDDIMTTHDIILQKTGGFSGINNAGLISSIVEHVKNDDYYPTMIDKLTHIVFSLVMNHAFNDANKRSSIACGVLFLNINGYDSGVDDIIVAMEDVVVSIAEGSISKGGLRVILRDIVSKKVIL